MGITASALFNGVEDENCIPIFLVHLSPETRSICGADVVLQTRLSVKLGEIEA